MGYRTALYTGQGGRPYNEDSVYCSSEGENCLAIVADGLGSHGGGEIASAEAIKSITGSRITNSLMNKEALWMLVRQANRAVMDKQTAACAMKTTLAMLIACKEKTAVVHVGDSRVYQFIDGRMAYWTTDHSVSQMAVYSGDITHEQIRFHEDRNRLLRALGSEDEVKPDIYFPNTNARQNNYFLLCSDGFWEYVNEYEMEADLSKAASPEQWLSYMLTRIGKRVDGKNDNLSAVAVWDQKWGNK